MVGMTTKDVTLNHVVWQDVKGLLERAGQSDCEISEYEGTLLDNYILSDTQELNVGGYKTKYIICKETYKNAWQSDYTVILTNDEETLNEYLTLFESYLEEEEN
jgi:hypothetical protein